MMPKPSPTLHGYGIKTECNSVVTAAALLTNPLAIKERSVMADSQSTVAADEIPERWRPVLNYEGLYEVSSRGNVRSLSTYRNTYYGRILSPTVSKKGYLYLALRKDRNKKTIAVHRMVLEAFLGSCPQGKQVAHYNGDPSDNRLENLRWATAKENIADRTRHGRTCRGEDQHSAKLDKHVVKTIKKLRGCGFSGYEIARLACVSPSTIESIWNGKTWTHV